MESTEYNDWLKKLDESENWYRGLYRAISGGIIVQNYAGVIIEANNAACEMLGLTQDQLRGKTSFDPSWHAIHEDGSPYPRDTHPARVTLKTGKAVKNAVMGVFHPKEEKYRWFVINSEPILDPKNKVQAVATIFLDITEHKQAEEAIQRQAALIDLSPDAIIVRDLKGTVTFWSKGAEKLYGWSKSQAIGKNTDKLLETIFPKPFDEITSDLKTKQVWKGELIHKTKDGRRVTVQSWWLAEQTEMSVITSILESNVDITDRIALEKQLQDKERLAAIGATAGMVGHDIRNPLQAINGELFLIEGDIASLGKSDVKEVLTEGVKNVQKNLLYIAKIVEDLQDYAKPLKPNFEKVRIEKVIEEVLPLVTIDNNYKVVIDVEKGFPDITTDFLMLKRALTNLTQNGIQAMPEGGKLTIRAYRKDDQLFITVEDTGVGIPDHVKPKLFNPMVSTKAKGQGFGLAVVKRLVEALNGKVSFESQEGKGAKFIIELPSRFQILSGFTAHAGET